MDTIEEYIDVSKYFLKPNNDPFKVVIKNAFRNAKLVHPIHQRYVFEIIKELRKYKDVKIVIGLCGNGTVPNSNRKSDFDAAYKMFFNVTKGNPWSVSLFSDPIILGKYPDEYYELYSDDELPDIGKDDMKIIKNKLK